MNINHLEALFSLRSIIQPICYILKKSVSIITPIKREKQLKKWNKDWKWDLIKEKNPELSTLPFYL